MRPLTALASFATFATCFAAAAAAHAETPSAPPAGPDMVRPATESYCRYVAAVAESTSAPMLSPTLFTTFGMANGTDVSAGGTSASTSTVPRLVAGAQYSFSGLYRGIAVRTAAQADCARYESFNKLLTYTYANHQGQSAPALAAKAAVLRGAMPGADAILARAKASLEESKMTVEEVEGIALRVDALRAAEGDTSGKLRVAQSAMRGPTEPVAAVVDRAMREEREVERQQAKVRQSTAWDLQVRGGYDKVFGQPQSIPAFAMVTVTFNPGYFWQTGADARAVEARGEAMYFGLESPSNRAVDLVRELRELRRAEMDRLAQVELVVVDLEARYKAVSAVEGDKARAVAEVLWLSIVPVKAEKAFLAAHVADLDRMLGPGSATLQMEKAPSEK